MEYSKFRSIGQFRNTVYDYNHLPDCDKVDSLTFKGTVKLHGTNASVYMNRYNQLVAGKRSSFLKGDSHFGFLEFSSVNENILTELICNLKVELDIIDKDVFIYGEWCGGNIQKGVGITGLPKMLYLFDLKVINDNGDNYYYSADKWTISEGLLRRLNDCNIFVSTQFETYTVDIDFNFPQACTAKIEELVLAVEKECPVAREFGVSGIGEGIVWTCTHAGKTFTMKTKGDKHSVSKVKKMVAIAPEKIDSIQKFVEYAVTENRMSQGVVEVYGSVEACTCKDARIGKFIDWVKRDVVKEELDVLTTNGLNMGDIVGQLKSTCSKYLFSLIEFNV